MGQFASKEFDGDPYIDLMRAIPERELVWWAQKFIWLAEGFTFVDHFTRTYPRMFVHQCNRCKGAGMLTCPACAGTKSLAAPAAAAARRPRLAAAGAGGARLSSGALGAEPAGAEGGLGPCGMCGEGCTWDAESEWQERWGEWESRLAYYDKATGPLMDEWYEDVINAGNLEEDTPPVEDDPPGPEVQGQWADDDRELAKDKKRMRAAMKRFGHPYDGDATLGYQIVDPTATMGENVWNMAQVYNSLPPELNPLRIQHLGNAGGEGPSPLELNAAAIEAFEMEIAKEACIMQNLDAAVQDRHKPNRFKATAGTIPCTDCGGQAWSYNFFAPNADALFGLQRPFWHDTLVTLQKYWNPTAADGELTGHMLPYGEHGLRSLLAAAAADDPLRAIHGRAPKTTGRYRQELELLVANPELRDSRVQVPAGQLADYLQGEGQGGEEDSSEGSRDIAASATPLRLPGRA